MSDFYSTHIFVSSHLHWLKNIKQKWGEVIYIYIIYIKSFERYYCGSNSSRSISNFCDVIFDDMDVRRNRIGIYFKNRNGDEQATKSAVRFAIPLLIDNTVDQDFASNDRSFLTQEKFMLLIPIKIMFWIYNRADGRKGWKEY